MKEELKTLKDMEHYNSWEGFKGHIEEKELKAEAVKDYKAAKKGNILDVLSYIRWKNNLTEADLK